MKAWIALRIGVHADEMELTGLDACLLHQLPATSVVHPLADIDETAGEGVVTDEGRMPSLDQQHPAFGIDCNAIGGQPRRNGLGHLLRLSGCAAWICRRRPSARPKLLSGASPAIPCRAFRRRSRAPRPC